MDYCSHVRAIAIDPNAPNNVYVAGCHNLYKSIDGGDNWVEFYDGRAVIYDIFVPWLPPSPVEDFMADSTSNQIHLSWTNPSDADFVETHIRFRTDTFPTAHTMGISLTVQTNSPGSTDAFTHTGLSTNELYYYAAFAYDNDGNYAQPAWISATVQADLSAMYNIPSSVDRSDENDSSQGRVYIATSLGLYRSLEEDEPFLIYLPVGFHP